MVGRKPGETERGIESLDLEARSLSHKFPFKYIKATRQVFFVSSSLCIIVYPQSYLIFVIFFTRAKVLENKIYTEKRLFFALNL